MSGFDWNGNDYHDVGDSYMDYEIMNDKGGGGGRGSGGSSGCGCLLAVIIIVIILVLL